VYVTSVTGRRSGRPLFLCVPVGLVAPIVRYARSAPRGTYTERLKKVPIVTTLQAADSGRPIKIWEYFGLRTR
jgi:hypothetical protein